jgi:hypothetical protein
MTLIQYLKKRYSILDTTPIEHLVTALSYSNPSVSSVLSVVKPSSITLS